MKSHTILALGIITLLTGCMTSERSDITGEWINTHSPAKDNATYTFTKSGKFFQTIENDNNYVLIGNWEHAPKSEIKVTFPNEEKPTDSINVEFITKDKILCTWGKTKFVMYRAPKNSSKGH